MGSDAPDESEGWDGRPRENVFNNNVVSDTENGVQINDADDNSFTCESDILVVASAFAKALGNPCRAGHESVWPSSKRRKGTPGTFSE